MPVASKFPKELDALAVDAANETGAVSGKADPKFEPTGEGHHAKNHNLANAAINAVQDLLKDGRPGDVLIGDDEGIPFWTAGALPVTAFGAVADEFYTDGKVVNGSTTFTSASAKFTVFDVGKTVVIGKGGPSSSQDHHTTIKEVKSATEVVLNNAAQRSQEKCRWLISRAGDQTAAIQAAIDEAEKRGGAKVFLNGVGFLASQINLKNRVGIVGMGRRGTCLHQVHQSNKPLVITDYTENDSAGSCAVEHIWLDGARARQSDVTTTLSAKYTAGDSTLKLTSAANFLPVGMVIVGTTRIHYTKKNGNTLEGLTAGLEDTTDATSESGTTVTQKSNCAIYMIRQPFNTGGTYEEAFDSHHIVRTVLMKNFKGDGLHNWAQSEVRCEDVWGRNCDEYSFRPSFDTFLANCISDTSGRSGYYTFGASSGGSNNKAFFAGGVTPEAGHGFFFEGKPNFDNEGSKAWMGCIAQDNKAYGFYGRNADLINVSGAASSNSTSSKGTYAGIGLDGVRRSILSVVCTEREGATSTQQNALNLLATTRKCAGNTIVTKHYRAGGTATVGTAIKAGSDLTGGNDIQVNGMGGVVAPAYAAEYTPDPYEATNHIVGALTGNCTIKAPANAHLGCPLTFLLTQDSVGGRKVAWNAAFSTGGLEINPLPGSVTVATFIYNGTSWVYRSAGPQVASGGFGRRLLRILTEGLQDATVVIVGDSTSAGYSSTWVGAVVDGLAARFPAYTVKYRDWTDGNTDYNAASTKQTGSGSKTLTVYNCAVAGKDAFYQMAPNFEAMIASKQPDLIVFSHGHNHGGAGTLPAFWRQGLVISTQSILKACPTSEVVLFAQNPRTDAAATVQAERQHITEQVAHTMGAGFLNVHRLFLDTDPAASSLLADTVHPNSTGYALISAEVLRRMTTAAGLPSQQRPTLTELVSVNGLTNGDFSSFAVPPTLTGWNVTNTTLSKDETNFESPNGYAVKMVSASAATAFMSQKLEGNALKRFKGNWVTLLVRVRVPSGQAARCGGISLVETGGSHAGTDSTGALSTNGQGDWRWQMVSRRLATDCTSITVQIVLAESAVSQECSVDRAILIPGVWPRDIR
jgi:lysophospholipase L1-like esterase